MGFCVVITTHNLFAWIIILNITGLCMKHLVKELLNKIDE